MRLSAVDFPECQIGFVILAAMERLFVKSLSYFGLWLNNRASDPWWAPSSLYLIFFCRCLQATEFWLSSFRSAATKFLLRQSLYYYYIIERNNIGEIETTSHCLAPDRRNRAPCKVTEMQWNRLPLHFLFVEPLLRTVFLPQLWGIGTIIGFCVVNFFAGWFYYNKLT
jgi:hypothetical protein